MSTVDALVDDIQSLWLVIHNALTPPSGRRALCDGPSLLCGQTLGASRSARLPAAIRNSDSYSVGLIEPIRQCLAICPNPILVYDRHQLRRPRHYPPNRRNAPSIRRKFPFCRNLHPLRRPRHLTYDRVGYLLRILAQSQPISYTSSNPVSEFSIRTTLA